VDVDATVRSTGTVHRDFRGGSPLRLRGAGTAVAFPDFTVMRGSIRDITTTWDPPLLCICHPRLSIVNAGGDVQTRSVRVIVFPLPLLGIIVAVLLILVAAYRLGRRRYQQHVIVAAGALARPAGVGHP
ncbi:MAG: hypothetical protein ABI776_03750, partial [Nocardioidaceae bacterium]